MVVYFDCCSGWNLTPFTYFGFRTVGYDYDMRFLEYGRRHGIELYDLNKVEPSVISRDAALVLATDVLEHARDPFALLSTLNSLIRPGGHLFLAVPSLCDIPFGYAGGDPLGEFQNAHLFLFDDRTLSAYLAMSGFEPVKMRQDLRVIARKIGEPSRKRVPIPGNYGRNMRRLRISHSVCRHFCSTLYRRVLRYNFGRYHRVRHLLSAMVSPARLAGLLGRRLKT
jgi:hypothetical protein